MADGIIITSRSADIPAINLDVASDGAVIHGEDNGAIVVTGVTAAVRAHDGVMFIMGV